MNMAHGRVSEGDDDEFDAKMQRDPGLFACAPTRATRTFGFDWASGFVSPFLSSSRKDAEAVVRRVQLSERDHVVDLGSGDGTLLLQVARATGASGTGVELDEGLVHEARKKQLEMAVSRVQFTCQDLFDFDVDKATVILLFLLPQALNKLAGKMKRFLRDTQRCSATVVTNKWPLPDCKEYLHEEICKGEVHLYIYCHKQKPNKK